MGCPGETQRSLHTAEETPCDHRGRDVEGWPQARKPGAAEDAEAERTLLWGLWEELGTPHP